MLAERAEIGRGGAAQFGIEIAREGSVGEQIGVAADGAREMAVVRLGESEVSERIG